MARRNRESGLDRGDARAGEHRQRNTARLFDLQIGGAQIGSAQQRASLLNAEQEGENADEDGE